MKLKESRIFTVGSFHGNRTLTTMSYCYTTVNSQGVLKWITRVSYHMRNITAKKLTAHIRMLVKKGLVFMAGVKQGQIVNEEQQEILQSCGLLDHVQPMLNNRFKPIK